MTGFCLQPSTELSRGEIAAVLDKLSQAAVAVIGDFCLDGYWTIDRSASEVSLETGLPTEPVRSQRYAPGGAGNVVMNLLALGVKRIFPVGVLGEDPFGRELRRLLDGPAVDPCGLISQSADWATHTYLKPHVSGQELSRLDHGNFNRLAAETEDEIFAQLAKILSQVAVVLVNHQAIGSLHDSESFRYRLAAEMARHPEVSFIIDSRGHHGAYSRAIHKLNDREIRRACGRPVVANETVSLDELVGLVEELRTRWKSPLVVTRGDRGCLVFSEDGYWKIEGVQLPGAVDPVGAGDTFVATLAAVIATGPNLTAAAFVANIAAAVTAQKLLQTGTASPGEILTLAGEASFSHQPELAKEPNRARYVGESEIECIVEPPAALEIQHAIFDHDGTLSTLREGWEKIMEPMMVRTIMGDASGSVEERVARQIHRRVREFIDRSTGIQTIAQMQGLVDLVKEFGLVPAAAVRSAEVYKSAYNQELKALVARRLVKLDRGELSVDDFRVSGAEPFLRALQRAGVKLYLASGTDQLDVQQEAARLGYGEVFDGGIYGYAGQPTEEAKKVVLKRILAQIGGAAERIITFGDGPVEIRETIRRGAYAVGVASDERRRFGLNVEKRERLIRAGAGAVVPDFSQWPVLGTFLRLQLVNQ